uniref:Anthranilate synthase component 2 n=1 Tax=Polysiphonia sertularioides TaxID=945028 RepID=A0A1Z1M8L0_9FLOR|nr:Anthranilate synthase component II [Polysiphonia sertularioides]ARW62417.1 Anthranilate synthase component II [Polysiphonia sertularioides]
MIIIIDNYDSFTHNLVQYAGELKYSITVVKNDKIKIRDIEKKRPTHIIISPGPGKPQDAGICIEVIKTYGNEIPILGICLGHQAIGNVHGGLIKKLKTPVHGKVDYIFNNQKDIFKGIKNKFEATRYHSLIVDKTTLPKELEITAWTKDSIVMGFKHKSYNKLQGIQFHPESLWTKEGKKIIKNFLLS